MTFSSLMDKLPIEAWAETTARLVRRTRRSVARRPLRAAIGSAAAVAVVMIGSNALWDQQSRHPAPLWGGDGAPIVATHAPAGDTGVARRVDGRATDNAAPDTLVRRVQIGLSEAGYFDGTIDGMLGEDTAAAIRAFESGRGLPVTGEPTVGLLAAVSEPPAAFQDEVVAVAASVPAASPAPRSVSTVPEIQAALNSAGYGPLEVDGVMGPRTRAALAQFAQSRGLEGQGMTPAVLRALGEAAR